MLRRGPGDPTMRLTAGEVWRSSRTPEGPATVRLRVVGTELVTETWGPGAEWLSASVPALVGESDDWSGLDLSAHPMLQRTRRLHPGVRLPRTGLVMDALVPAVLEQRVTGTEAWRAWRSVVGAFGEPAPVPDSGSAPAELRLRVAPSPERLLEVPSWEWHRFGVDGQRYRTARAAATVATRLEECVQLAAAGDLAAAHRRLRVVPGVGEWTAAETSLRALGDADAVSVGDFHLKNLVGFALTGAARTDDETMVGLLETWRGQRARVVRLIELSGLRPPKYGPRFSPHDMRAM